jgi:hypothetical protein
LPHSPHARRLLVFRRLNDPAPESLITESAVAGDEGLDQSTEAVDADEEQELEG